MQVALAAKLSFVTRAATVAAAALLATTACGGSGAVSGGPLRLDLEPSTAKLEERVAISVHGLSGTALDARLAGAADSAGHVLPWTHLTNSGGTWRGVLPAPAQLGIYLVQLRAGAGARIVGSRRWLVRVFRPGTLARRSFATPEGVARDWVATLPGHATLVALRAWRRLDDDHRDRRLHRLFVLAYSLRGHPAVGDRLGIWVTAVRDGFAGRWRLLEATALP